MWLPLSNSLRNAYFTWAAASITLTVDGSGFVIANGGETSWRFDEATGLRFPDNTYQTTAYTGPALAVTTVAKTGSAIPGTGEVATITLSPTNNTNLTPGVYPGIFIGLGLGFTSTFTVASNGDITAEVTSSNGEFSVGDNGTIGGTTIGGTIEDIISFTVATLTNIVAATALNLTKSVNKLTPGYYSLADGVEGQIMYLVRQTGLSTTVEISVAHARNGASEYTDYPHYPFAGGSSNDLVTLIFTDGHWQSSGNSWD
jgi:hypothetical protein